MSENRTVLSDGTFQFEVVGNWPMLPPEIDLGEVAAVAVDKSDTVYLFTRGNHPIIVLDRDGRALRTWGHGIFKGAHGLDIGPDGSIYCTDHIDHTVRRFTSDGKLQLEIGVPGKPAPFMGGSPFHLCTHTALSPDGAIYVADGYGNANIHKFAPNGRLVTSWGRSGCGPGEFYIPHNLVCDEQGWVYVADRENHRIQVFNGDGKYETQWNNMHRPCALCRGTNTHGLFYVGELGPFGAAHNTPNLGPRLTVLNAEGAPVARLAAGPAGMAPGHFIAPHGIAVDSAGDVYVAEVSTSAWPFVFPDTPPPHRIPTLRKLRRVREAAQAAKPAC